VNPPNASPPLARLLELTAEAVQSVRSGRSLTEVLAACPPAARPGTQALSFAVLRRWGSACAVREIVAPRNPPPAVDALLTTALALLWPSEAPMYPDHTLVDQAVAAARRKVPAAAGFINAVLRRFIRERPALVTQAGHSALGAWNHPPWWVERLRHDWPAGWQGLLAQAQQHPPMTLRVNTAKVSVADYQHRLGAAGIAARTVAGFDQALVLAAPVPVDRLPGFAAGEVSVQDLAAQQAAPLLLGPGGLPEGARVLDACAAPGGKTAHLLERAPGLGLLALDADPARLLRVDDTLRRLGLAGPGVRTRAADARQVASWWDGEPFDAILLDAPCTASGIVRRHPDIRWLRRPDDVHALARTQAELLQALWPLVKPGGRLLYATCSIFRAEGAEQIDAFLQRLGPEAARLDPDSPGHLLPLADNGPANPPDQDKTLADGFFYALLHKP
jgi:16S rRNA (cytosine967-C5)-methyltransferase